MALFDQVYKYNLLLPCRYAEVRTDRTGIGTRGIFGERIVYEVPEEKFPVLTLKKVHFHSIVTELLWFIRGETTLNFLHEHEVSIWDEWADKDGHLGPIYGKQWRDWNGVDQLAKVVNSLRNDPFSRRHIVSAWNVSAIQNMALPPCHLFFQFYVTDENRLDMQVYQRSADVFLGVPFNLTSYALLLCIMGKLVGRETGHLIYIFGDLHLYLNHEKQAKQMTLRSCDVPPPKLKMPKFKTLSDVENLHPREFSLLDYSPYPPISAPVAV